MNISNAMSRVKYMKNKFPSFIINEPTTKNNLKKTSFGTSLGSKLLECFLELYVARVLVS